MEQVIAQSKCPCCGELIPVEVVIHSKVIESYLDFMTVQPAYNDEDDGRTWPVVHLEIGIDTKALIENPEEFLEYHERMVSIGAAEPVSIMTSR